MIESSADRPVNNDEQFEKDIVTNKTKRPDINKLVKTKMQTTPQNKTTTYCFVGEIERNLMGDGSVVVKNNDCDEIQNECNISIV